jgi:SAM-dependent methyltransferase
MMSASQWNPTGRFTGLAGLYAQYRPGYPEEAQNRCGLDGSSLLVDVGCGTGISSRLFASRGISVIGIEPNADMRRQAQAAPLCISPQRRGEIQRGGVPVPVYQEGRAEGTGLNDGSAHAVLAAQAFHWFDPEAALREFHRILKPDGWVVLLWNERDESDAFMAVYGSVMRTLPEAETFEPHRGRGEALFASPLFRDGEKRLFSNVQILDEEGFLGRSFSVSYAPRESASAERFAARLRDVFGRYQQQDRVVLHYETSVFLARRRS